MTEHEKPLVEDCERRGCKRKAECNWWMGPAFGTRVLCYSCLGQLALEYGPESSSDVRPAVRSSPTGGKKA